MTNHSSTIILSSQIKLKKVHKYPRRINEEKIKLKQNRVKQQLHSANCHNIKVALNLHGCLN